MQTLFGFFKQSGTNGVTRLMHPGVSEINDSNPVIAIVSSFFMLKGFV